MVVLILIILLLLYLIWKLGLGGGDGKLLPGDGLTTGKAATEPQLQTAVTEPIEEPEKPQMRRELLVSFQPLRDEPTVARELCCSVTWINLESGRPESSLLEADNMADFEFELERLFRGWRQSLGTGDTEDIPVIAVRMFPFPGEGVFRKIETIARKVDGRMNILRLESP